MPFHTQCNMYHHNNKVQEVGLHCDCYMDEKNKVIRFLSFDFDLK